MATTGEDRLLRVWDVRRRRPVATLQSGALVDDVGLSPDGKTLAVTTGTEPGQGSIEIYSIPRLARTAVLHAPWGRWGRFSPDGRVSFSPTTRGGSGSSTPRGGSHARPP